MTEERDPGQDITLSDLLLSGMQLQQTVYLKRTLGSLTALVVSSAAVTVFLGLKAGLLCGLLVWAVAQVWFGLRGRKVIRIHKSLLEDYKKEKGLDQSSTPSFSWAELTLLRFGAALVLFDQAIPDWVALAVIAVVVGGLVFLAVKAM